MDTFFEQIVSIRKDAKSIAALVGIWLAAFLLIFVLLFMLGGYFGLLLSAGAIYGAYKLSTRLSVEYEYIVVNSSMDVDKIIAKSSRKRMASFELSKVDRIEKYNPAARPVGNFAKTVIACNENDPGTYFMIVSEEGKGNTLIVFSPDDRVKGAIVKALPRFIANSAFKD